MLLLYAVLGHDIVTAIGHGTVTAIHFSCIQLGIKEYHSATGIADAMHHWTEVYHA